jgi:hypothetical protein
MRLLDQNVRVCAMKAIGQRADGYVKWYQPNIFDTHKMIVKLFFIRKEALTHMLARNGSHVGQSVRMRVRRAGTSVPMLVGDYKV